MWNAIRNRMTPGAKAMGDAVCLYAVGDIHGRADLLDAICERIDLDIEQNPSAETVQIFLGDYVDRGPASAAVIATLSARCARGNAICLRGNHEACMLDFLANPDTLGRWRQMGGMQTLMSYGLTPSPNPGSAERHDLARALAEAMPAQHLSFLQSLTSSYTKGRYFFCHAGIRPGVALDRQRDEDLLWIRDEFLFSEDNFGKVVIHGHTPVHEPDVRPNRINIDTGAYATGRLTCLKLCNETHSFI